MPAETKIQVRRGTAAQWTAGIILSAGEFGFETDTGKFKIGNGSTSWGSLAYAPQIVISDTPPASPIIGQLWYESDTGLTYIYYDSAWVEIASGPAGASITILSTSITANTTTTVDTWSISTYRSAKYVIQAVQGTKYTVSEIVVIHDGTTATMTEYGVVELGASRIPLTVSATVSGGNVLIQVTITDAATTNATVKVSPLYITV